MRRCVLLRVDYACGKQPVCKCSLCVGLFWKVVVGDWWLLVSALSGGELENSPGDR